MESRFRTLLQKGIRVGLIMSLVGGIFAFGHFMTPEPNDALAEWFLEGGGSMEGVPAHMQLRVNEGDVNEVYLNGNTMYYTQYSSDKPVGQLLDYYENLYRGDTRPLADDATKKALLEYVKDDADRAEHARRIQETERLMNERFVRLEGDTWGAFATIVTGREGEADWAEDMKARFEAYDESRKVGALGDPKIVVAFDAPEGGSQYLNVWPDKEFDQRSLRPRKGEDAPGYDIEDIQRPRDSFRMVTFGQEQFGKDYSILVYRGPGTVDGVEAHFLREMQEDGWGLSTRVLDGKELMESEADPPPAHLFAKDNREAYVSLQETTQGWVTSTIVVYRRG